MLHRVCLTLLAVLFCGGAMAASEADRQAMNAAYREYQEVMAKGPQFRDEAIAPAARAYELAREVYGTAHQTTAALAINYGNILQNRGEARQVLEQALEISEAVWGGEGIELVDPLMALGGVSTDLRQIDDARNYYERALRITRKQQEPDSLVEGIILLSLGVSNYNDRRLESIRQFREAREILSKHDGSLAEIRLATADLWIGTHHVASGRHREAIGPLLASLDTFNQYAETRFSVLTNLKLLVEAYEAQGLRDEATPHALHLGQLTMTEPVLLYEVIPAVSRVRSPGLAEVSFTVDSQGFPRNVELIGSPADERFAAAALENAPRLRYAPRYVDGSPVDTPDIRHTFRFGPRR